jgi:hypothetical protein
LSFKSLGLAFFVCHPERSEGPVFALAFALAFAFAFAFAFLSVILEGDLLLARPPQLRAPQAHEHDHSPQHPTTTTALIPNP